MLERTLFSRQPLRGAGTGQVQCLRSYITLLAFAHNLKPRKVLELLAQRCPDVPTTSTAMSFFGDANVHTGSNVSKRLRKAVEGATGADLRSSTLEALATSFSMHRSCGTGAVRYCPLCVREDKDMPYGRLLWELSFVKACPHHAVELRGHVVCGAPESERLALQHRPSLDGVCSACGSIGFRCITSAPVAAASDDLAQAREAQRLICAMCDDQVQFDLEKVKEGVAKAVDALYGGSTVRAATCTGLSRASVWTWLQPGRGLSLPFVIQFCLRSGVDLIALCNGAFERCTNKGASSFRVKSTYRRSGISTQTLKKMLVDAAASEHPPSVCSFARKLGVHIDAPRQRAPQEAQQLAAAHARYQEEHVAAQFEFYTRRFSEAAQSLIREGRSVHRRALQDKAGVATFSRGLRRDALDRVLALHVDSVAPKRARTSERPFKSQIEQTLANLQAQLVPSNLDAGVPELKGGTK